LEALASIIFAKRATISAIKEKPPPSFLAHYLVEINNKNDVMAAIACPDAKS
jgi:hypothetical protein